MNSLFVALFVYFNGDKKGSHWRAAVIGLMGYLIDILLICLAFSTCGMLLKIFSIVVTVFDAVMLIYGCRELAKVNNFAEKSASVDITEISSDEYWDMLKND